MTCERHLWIFISRIGCPWWSCGATKNSLMSRWIRPSASSRKRFRSIFFNQFSRGIIDLTIGWKNELDITGSPGKIPSPEVDSLPGTAREGRSRNFFRKPVHKVILVNCAKFQLPSSWGTGNSRNLVKNRKWAISTGSWYPMSIFFFDLSSTQLYLSFETSPSSIRWVWNFRFFLNLRDHRRLTKSLISWRRDHDSSRSDMF